MAQLYTQAVPHHFTFNIFGPATATSVAPSQPITLTFDDGSSVTIPQDVPAVLPDSTTTWDRTSAVYVLYALKGDGTLRAQRESQLATISGDYAPVARVLHDTVRAYQPMQPGGAAVKSGAWSGGAVLGSARSWSGGASGSGIIWYPAIGNNESKMGMYVLCTSFPAAQTTLYDMNAGGNGYERTSVTAAGHVIAEYSNSSVSFSTDLGSMPLGEWCWITTGTTIDRGANDNLRCLSGVYNQAGTLIGFNNTSVAGMAINRDTTFWSSTLSFGLPGSGGYAAAPNDSTLRASKFRHLHDTGEFTLSPLGGDISSDLNDYMARQSVGAATTLIDTGTAPHSLTAGSGGLTILASGPYP